MRLQTKFGVGIVLVFVTLAISLAIASVVWIERNTIQEAEQRVKLYIQSSWEIYNGKLARMQSALEILALDQQTITLLENPNNRDLANLVRAGLEGVRKQQNVETLSLLDRQGRVILRSRPPYTTSGAPTLDRLLAQVMSTRAAGQGTLLLTKQQLQIEGEGLLEQCVENGGAEQGMMLAVAVPILRDGQILGILQMGSLLNGSAEKVDRIRDTVFKNEQYGGKPLGTATIFMGDLRISTNVMTAQGQRALGTRASPEVSDQVLRQSLPWNGRAWVVDRWYLAQYDPIREPGGDVIGMLYVGELEEKYVDQRTQALALFLGILGAGMALAFVIFFLIIRSILGPIRNLSVATVRLASGDLSHRVPTHNGHASKDEIENLAASFNTMAEQLERQHEQIEKDKADLATLNQELRTTNRNYMEMLGFVTHELKNPLSSAILNVYTVKDEYVGPVNDTQKEALTAVAKSLNYFGEMIRNYLDLSRLEKGELIPRMSHFPLNEAVVVPALASLERDIQQKNMLVENCVPTTVVLEADRDLIRIVYDNLISNAVKYGKEGGRIILEAQTRAEQIDLSVFNDGKGIPQDKIPLLFQKFSRLDTPEYAGKKGTGLGLYICREIIEKHNGSIRVESQEGQWTRFIFTLARAAKYDQGVI